MNIRQTGAELLHADRHTDRQTDMTKLIVALGNSANAPKSQSVNTVRGSNRCLSQEPYETQN
jgi:hypothetical protein